MPFLEQRACSTLSSPYIALPSLGPSRNQTECVDMGRIGVSVPSDAIVFGPCLPAQQLDSVEDPGEARRVSSPREGWDMLRMSEGRTGIRPPDTPAGRHDDIGQGMSYDDRIGSVWDLGRSRSKLAP